MFSTFQIFSFTYPLSCFGCSGAIRNQLYLDTAESGTLLVVLGGLLGASWKADLVVLTLDFLKFPAALGQKFGLSPWISHRKFSYRCGGVYKRLTFTEEFPEAQNSKDKEVAQLSTFQEMAEASGVMIRTGSLGWRIITSWGHAVGNPPPRG